MKARVSRDGCHIICGKVDCGYRLAKLVCLAPSDHGRLVPADHGLPHVVFGLGWTLEGRAWRLSNRAMQRLQRQKRLGRSQEAIHKPRRPPRVDEVTHNLGAMSFLPIEVVCPLCRSAQVVELDGPPSLAVRLLTQR